MPEYLFQANYAVGGVKGLIKEGGSSRVAAVEKAAQSVGGKVESYYFAFGDVDAYIIAELPHNAAAAAMVLTVNGSVRAAHASVLPFKRRPGRRRFADPIEGVHPRTTLKNPIL